MGAACRICPASAWKVKPRRICPFCLWSCRAGLAAARRCSLTGWEPCCWERPLPGRHAVPGLQKHAAVQVWHWPVDPRPCTESGCRCLPVVCRGVAANRSKQSRHAAWLNRPATDLKGQGCTFVKRGSSRSSSWLEAGARISIRRTSALPTCSTVKQLSMQCDAGAIAGAKQGKCFTSTANTSSQESGALFRSATD